MLPLSYILESGFATIHCSCLPHIIITVVTVYSYCSWYHDLGQIRLSQWVQTYTHISIPNLKLTYWIQLQPFLWIDRVHCCLDWQFLVLLTFSETEVHSLLQTISCYKLNSPEQAGLGVTKGRSMSTIRCGNNKYS